MLKRYCTAVSCMDGRIQLPVIKYLQTCFNAEFVSQSRWPNSRGGYHILGSHFQCLNFLYVKYIRRISELSNMCYLVKSTTWSQFLLITDIIKLKRAKHVKWICPYWKTISQLLNQLFKLRIHRSRNHRSCVDDFNAKSSLFQYTIHGNFIK